MSEFCRVRSFKDPLVPEGFPFSFQEHAGHASRRRPAVTSLHDPEDDRERPIQLKYLLKETKAACAGTTALNKAAIGGAS